MNIFRKRVLLLAPAVVLAAGLSACKGGDGPAASGSAPSGTPSSAAAASQAVPASAAASAASSAAGGAAAGGSGGGSGGSAAAAEKLPAPCSLIGTGEATATLGYPVTSVDSSADNDPDQVSCVYLHGSTPVMVVLIRRWSLGHFTADAAKEPGPPSKLPGVGTSAYLGANDNGPVVLAWERGVSVAVSVVRPVSAGQAKSFAKVAVGQLDKG